ncbi:MAG: hypothetical protein GF330_14880 [Candidatus Eisenbacteria bacterium]|nr:hypothetical protein [Candidatus Eisenbacteria bacterium]
MEFTELVTTARLAGFEVLDGNGLPVTEEALVALEDENIGAEQVRLEFHEAITQERHAIVADVHVRDQIYHLAGDPRGVEELKLSVGGSARPQEEPWD